MLNYLVAFFSFFVSLTLHAQVKGVVYVSTLKSSYILFPSAVKYYEVGTQDIQTATKIIAGKTLRIQAIEGVHKFRPTNLFITDEEENSYYFDVFYSDTLKDYRFYPVSAIAVEKKEIPSVSQTTPAQPTITPTTTPALASPSLPKKKSKKTKTATADETAVLTHILSKKDGEKIFSENQGVEVRYLNLYYYQDKFYFKIKYTNKSQIDFDFLFTNFFRTKEQAGQKTTEQDLQVFPLATHFLPSVLSAGKEHIVIYVFSKFTLENNEQLVLDTKEKTGEREVSINIPPYFITYARKIINLN